MQEDVYDALREVLPQIQRSIRNEIQEEFKAQLEKTHQYYQSCIEQMVRKNVDEIKIHYDQSENIWRKQLSAMQRERQCWLKMEDRYKQIINDLTSQLRSATTTNKKIGEMQQKRSQPIATSPQYDKLNIHPPPNKWKKQASISVQCSSLQKKKDSSRMPLDHLPSKQNFSSSSSYKSLKQDKREQLKQRIQQDESHFDSIQKYLSPEVPSQPVQSSRHFTSILSPPKSKQLIQQSNVKQESQSIFWDKENKKKLLSMIRKIK